MTHSEELPAGEAIERIIRLLNEAERLRITFNHEAANAATLGEPPDLNKARSVQQQVSRLKYQFSQAAEPFIIVAQTYGIDSSPLDDFIRTGDDALVSGAIRVLRQVQGHILRMGLNAPAVTAASDANHSEDFTSVNWYGTSYTFSKGNQAESVRVLWEAWEAGGHSLSQETIKEKIESSADRFELRKTFSRHPAWGTMIVDAGKGKYRLATIIEE